MLESSYAIGYVSSGSSVWKSVCFNLIRSHFNEKLQYRDSEGGRMGS